MKTSLIAVPLLSMFAVAAAPASAQAIKPGLWEVKSSLGKGYGKSLAAVAANNKKMIAEMSPATRKEMEAIEAENADEVQYTDDHVITKSCITKEQASKLDKVWGKQDNCNYQNSPLVGGVMKMTFSCTDSKSTGTGTLRLRGDTGFDMEMTSSGSVQGKRFDMKATASGKWLGANCGKIEPDTDEE
jgi:hypothetical protein